MRTASILSVFVMAGLCSATAAVEPEVGKSNLRVFYPKEYPTASRDKIDAVFSSKRHTFVDANDGLGVGGLRMLRFRGDTIALNLFIAGLAKCESITIDVLFRKPTDNGHFLSGYDWVVHKPAGKNNFVIRINVASKNFDFEKFVIPQINTEKADRGSNSKATTN